MALKGRRRLDKKGCKSSIRENEDSVPAHWSMPRALYTTTAPAQVATGPKLRKSRVPSFGLALIGTTA